LEGSPPEIAGEYDAGVPIAGGGLAEEYVASRFVFQERQIGDLSDDDHTQSLHVAVQGQDDTLHGQADPQTVLHHELCHLPTRHSGMQAADGEL